jgi:hypothetical protein
MFQKQNKSESSDPSNNFVYYFLAEGIKEERKELKKEHNLLT